MGFPEAENRLLKKKICMKCNARLSWQATICRKCGYDGIRKKRATRKSAGA